jgi:hypothetical protein
MRNGKNNVKLRTMKPKSYLGLDKIIEKTFELEFRKEA